jgi:hypothetical protein
MFSLKGRKDNFKLTIPDNFIAPEINEKYTRILKSQKSFIYKPIDFIRETINSIEILGFNNAVFAEQQTSTGRPFVNPMRIEENRFQHTSAEYNYISEQSPLNLIEKTLVVNFRHTLGFVNYFLMFENFWYQYSRDRRYDEISEAFSVDILNNKGEVYSRIIISSPLINSMDMLGLNYTQPIASSETFRVEFKYSNIDYQFIQMKEEKL